MASGRSKAPAGIALVCGVGFLLAGALMDVVGLGNPGFGAGQLILCVTGGVIALLGVLAMVGPTKKAGEGKRKRSRGKTLLFMGVPLLIFAGFLEVTARIAAPPPPPSPWQQVPGHGVELKPGAIPRYNEEALNDEGFRSPTRPPEKPAGTYRILVIGDSCAYDISVHDRADTWPMRLERLLNERISEATVEVINAGVPGFVSYQAIHRLQTRGLKYQPDRVILYCGWNDLGYSTRPEWKRNIDVSQFAFARRDYAGISTIAGSRLLGLVYVGVRGLFNKHKFAHLPIEGRADSGVPFNEEALAAYLENVEAVRLAAAEAGAALDMVSWPTMIQEQEPVYDEETVFKMRIQFHYYPLSWKEWLSWYERYQAAIKEYVAEKNLVLLDPNAQPGLAEHDPQLFADLVHPVKEGSRIMSDHFARILEPVVRADLSRAGSGAGAGSGSGAGSE